MSNLNFTDYVLRHLGEPITAAERKAAEESWPTGGAAKTLPTGMVETRYDEATGEWVDVD